LFFVSFEGIGDGRYLTLTFLGTYTVFITVSIFISELNRRSCLKKFIFSNRHLEKMIWGWFS